MYLSHNRRSKIVTVIKMNHKTGAIKKYQFRDVPDDTMKQLKFYLRKQWIGKFWGVLNGYELIH